MSIKYHNKNITGQHRAVYGGYDGDGNPNYSITGVFYEISGMLPASTDNNLPANIRKGAGFKIKKIKAHKRAFIFRGFCFLI